MTHFTRKVTGYLQLMRLDRPIGSLLLLWPTLWALWLAGQGRPDAWIVLVFITGVFVMRAAGCAMNDYADRNIDGQVKRTAQRPLVTGVVSPREAILLFVGLSLLGLVLVLSLNRLALELSVIGAVLAASYPFVKRLTHLPQLYLGLAFGWGIPMAYGAEANALPAAMWLLLSANIFWVIAYDTLYAMVDRDDDLRIGVKSTAVLFGRYDLLIIAICYGLMFACLLLLGQQMALNGYYFLGLVIALLTAGWQLYTARDRARDSCFKAFLNNSWVGAAIFFGLLLAFL